MQVGIFYNFFNTNEMLFQHWLLQQTNFLSSQWIVWTQGFPYMFMTLHYLDNGI